MASHSENRGADAGADGRGLVDSPDCPSQALLDAYRAGELLPPDAESVAKHLRSCQPCAERDTAIVARHERWVGRIRSFGSAARRRPTLPENVPGYDVLEEIGRGGQGLVYRAVQRSTRREVAIKLLAPDSRLSESARRRFEREIEVAASLQHAHIVHVLDSGRLPDGVRFVVMDYIRGESLLNHVRSRSLARDELLRLFAELCDGVGHAHVNGVIHRDLKPSNVLVDEHGSPRVLDFGLACAVDRAAHTALTLSGQVGGTLPYMSPEQARALPGAGDVRSDVYSLGVMLYELLAGQPPYCTDGDVIEALRVIAESQPVAPSRAIARSAERGRAAPRYRVDGDLDTIVLCALAKEPERRYQSAGALADELRCYLSGQPIAAKRDSAWYVLRKSLARNRLAAALGGGLFLTICASTVALGWMYADQRAHRARAESAADEADRQSVAAREAESRAEQRFEQLRELARVFLFELDPLICRLPGAAPARQAIVETGLRYVNALAEQARDEPETQLDLVGAYRTLGDMQGDVQSSSREDLDAALASYHEALDLVEQLESRMPADIRLARERALLLNKIGQALSSAAREDDARSSYLAAIAAVERALPANPEDASLLDSLADAHERLANTLIASDPVRAEHHYQIAMQLAQRLAKQSPENLWRQRDVGVAHTKLASIAIGRGDRDAALEHFREFLRVSEALLEARPDEIVARQDLLTGYQRLGILLSELDRRDEALAAFDRSIREGLSLEQDGDLTLEIVVSFATTYIKLGETRLSGGQLVEARRAFERAIELLQPRYEQHADREGVARLFGVAQYKQIEYFRAVAQDASLPIEQRAALWNRAAEWAEKCGETFLRMREQNRLDPSDAGVPDELAAEAANCRAAAAELMASGTP